MSFIWLGTIVSFTPTRYTYEQSFTLNEFYNLINNLKPTLTEDKQIYNDHVYLLNYNQCYSGILDCSYSDDFNNGWPSIVALLKQIARKLVLLFSIFIILFCSNPIW